VLKKIVFTLVVMGCGDAMQNKDFGVECEAYDDQYSHTILFCGGKDTENVEDIFEVCNYRQRSDHQVDGCVSSLDLMEFDSDCEVQHVCDRGE
jgi:hypothetical protein